ncbi:1,4-dihydroxy-2-naphthoate octaprenyltransferase [Betaproteobacteria bacterium]|nr:1,4-dihydroxy-2-naphthoate octaprenyltransferase [Betaproteobacteria bacterium]GHU43582.1 1,4-dihydroxy-2-naphthoate octaprenyltransferase [Betaproteobacteria bacterium]
MSTQSFLSRVRVWIETARPATLPLSFAAILTGSALAAWRGGFSWSITLLALLTASSLQILSNFANDYGDAIKGSDGQERLGPLRGMQKGQITVQEMRKALRICFACCIVIGSTLIWSACQSVGDIIGFLFLGLLAIIAAITYTIGKNPYGYLGLGDLSVLIFFGWLGVSGSYHLQTHAFDMSILLPATGCGLLATAVLNINNLRDLDADQKSGKRTLALRLGPLRARYYHIALLATAVICLSFYALFELKSLTGWLFLLATPLLAHQGWTVLHAPDGAALRPLLKNALRGALLTCTLFAAGTAMS